MISKEQAEKDFKKRKEAEKKHFEEVKRGNKKIGLFG